MSKKLETSADLDMNESHKSIVLKIDVQKQKVFVFHNQSLVKVFDISTAEKGLGQIKNSFRTPVGKHIIRAKIGQDLPINSVLVKRRPTGEIFNAELYRAFPERDWILTRILWLSGQELGKNRLGNCDTMQRYIYIHGTHEEDKIGTPASKGCIRMKNQDVIELFDMVPIGTSVEIFA
jgi:lipoprotein-anchoring transpeptidase ErfK/SrfK